MVTPGQIIVSEFPLSFVQDLMASCVHHELSDVYRSFFYSRFFWLYVYQIRLSPNNLC